MVTSNYISYWSGSSVFSASQTPWGYFDNDAQFNIDADKVSKYCANRLGYGIVDVELSSRSFYTAFEEATMTYGNEIYNFKIKDNYLGLEGTNTGSALNNAVINP